MTLSKNQSRPTSPHISIYKWLVTSTMSILHRFSGIMIYFWLLILSIIFICCAYCEKSVDFFNSEVNFAIFFIKFILVGGLLPFMYHFWNGVKYLFFDVARNVNNLSINRSALFVFVATFISYGFVIWKILF